VPEHHDHHHHYHPGGPDEGPPMQLDPAQSALVSALRGSFNILRVLMLVLVVLYLLSGLFRVEPGQQGLVARLGKLRMNPKAETETPVFEQGWHVALPDPFDEKYTITGEVQELAVTTFMFNHEEAATAKDLTTILKRSQDLQPGVDGAMLSGDKNLSHGRWEVQYRIDDAALFVQNIGDDVTAFEPLLRRLTETAVVREVAGRTIEEVTRQALDVVRDGVQRRLQAALNRLETGVTVLQLNAVTIEPGAVRPAFLDVVKAENEKKRLEHEAGEKATEILNRTAGALHGELIELIAEYGAAQQRGASEDEQSELLAGIDAKLLEAKAHGGGEVAGLLSTAEAEANEINETLRREYEEFVKYVEMRAARPRITLLGLWVQMREEILSNKNNEIFFVPASDDVQIVINRDPQRMIEREQEQALRRQRGQQPQ
jgi:regulator of protease activity HflC (stomatin/prohibitin superfamily)